MVTDNWIKKVMIRVEESSRIAALKRQDDDLCAEQATLPATTKTAIGIGMTIIIILMSST